MRYSDSYRRKPTPGAGQQGSPAPHYGTFNGSAPEVGQPFGATPSGRKKPSHPALAVVDAPHSDCLPGCGHGSDRAVVVELLNESRCGT